jgi:hypothetical protein
VAYQRVDFDPHARQRMEERKIGENQVLRAIAEPDRQYPSHSGRFVAERQTAAGNVIRVVYVEQDNGATAFVITVIRMSRR